MSHKHIYCWYIQTKTEKAENLMRSISTDIAGVDFHQDKEIEGGRHVPLWSLGGRSHIIEMMRSAKMSDPSGVQFIEYRQGSDEVIRPYKKATSLIAMLIASEL